MPKGYIIVTETIKDPVGLEAYARLAGATLAASGASILAVDDGPQQLEGEWHGDRTVVLEFESVEAARAWYDSAEYGEAKPLRHAAADANMVIVAGFEPPTGNG
ncbi:DUF1330 domain-containing protein [Streptomyces sp. WI04-05B]|uniref:DUF1330 domain-containing protein n=1 Tax=Streptomyces TaxID=1883 RepID=UPI0029B8B5FF|nr:MULTISPECIES: DUF1330 domain-containing protein [unclassified Streptomyces]MDX2541581.1 DUF1330 domain-containing protein [Streptomyces sp. WI04-05B]MDX2583685.1 DUF1330 domain-containing protein [Streptomyces sp. WI04-05A]MDX3745470.1 DUF1330 domain-containing protein [Streptomyces sp. AK08-02]